MRLPRRVPSLPAALLALCGAGGCSSGAAGSPPDAEAGDGNAAFFDCSTEPRALPAVPGLAVMSTSHALTASLETLTPASLVKGGNTWRVHLTDADSQPLAGAKLKVTPYMPVHQHGTSVKVGVSDLGAGEYELDPLYLYMAGYWEIIVNVTATDGSADTLTFPVCVPG